MDAGALGQIESLLVNMTMWFGAFFLLIGFITHVFGRIPLLRLLIGVLVFTATMVLAYMNLVTAGKNFESLGVMTSIILAANLPMSFLLIQLTQDERDSTHEDIYDVLAYMLDLLVRAFQTLCYLILLVVEYVRLVLILDPLAYLSFLVMIAAVTFGLLMGAV